VIFGDDLGQCQHVRPTGRQCGYKRSRWGSEEKGWPADPGMCARHLTAEQRAERDERQIIDYLDAFGGWFLLGDPACWSWRIPAETAECLARWKRPQGEMSAAEHVGLFGWAMRLYDQNRCSVCNQPGPRVEDHDHATGLVRGWLCRSCNASEGMNRGPDTIWARYRERNPYSILGVEVPYSGIGWEDGRWIGEGA
jgi:hypothetical protein